MTRYARQILVPGLGPKGQVRLSQSHVLVIGAGGLGCPALQYLGGAGVGRITLVDPDRVEESNLHRQPLYRMSDLGRAKVLAAQAHLAALNPEVMINPIDAALHPQNALHLVQDADVVVDAADSFAVSYILSDTCKALGTPLISASVLGQVGYVGGFCGLAPSLRAVFPELPRTAATCASACVLGPVVGMVSALQAQMALQILLDHAPSPLGKMVTLDLGVHQLGGFSFHDASEPSTVLPFISTIEVDPTDIVIELRDSAEAPLPILPQARRILPQAVKDFDVGSADRVVLCCTTGLRAWRAALDLAQVSPVRIALLAEMASG